jgi:hypothetical protein
MMRHTLERDKKVRRSCSVFAVLGFVIVLLLVAISLGWLGPIDNKLADLPIFEGS